jgi:hypothetical protein
VIVCAALLAVAINSVGGHHRDLITIFGPLIGAAFIGTGLLAWLRRPENRFGALMVALGFSYCLSALIVTTVSWTFIAGLAVIALPYAILFHILLAFPSGRLGTPGSRWLAAAAYLVATVGWWTCMLFQDTTRIGVPANPLMVADKPELFATLARIRLGLVATLICLLGVVLVRRWAASTRTQRRALAPVYLSGGLVLALYAVWAGLGVAQADPDLQETLEYARVISLAVVPFAFLAGLLRSWVPAAAAVNELVARLGSGREALRDALADALGDPTLRLAYWLPQRAEWIDGDGAAFPLLDADRDRVCTLVEHDGEPVAMLVHAYPNRSLGSRDIASRRMQASRQQWQGACHGRSPAAQRCRRQTPAFPGPKWSWPKVRWRSGGKSERRFVIGHARDEVAEVAAGEGPLEWLGDLVVVVLEGVETVDDGLQAGEVVGGEDLALDDREDDLDLVQPRGVERQVHEHEVRPLGLQASGRHVAAV